MIMTLVVAMGACRTSEKMLLGIYKSDLGDTLKIFDDHTFRAELKDPDTLDHYQVKYSGGRWNLDGNKLYLTPATKSMGNYWGCVPLKASINHLKRPGTCLEGREETLRFKKLVLKRKQRIRKHRTRT